MNSIKLNSGTLYQIKTNYNENPFFAIFIGYSPFSSEKENRYKEKLSKTNNAEKFNPIFISCQLDAFFSLDLIDCIVEEIQDQFIDTLMIDRLKKSSPFFNFPVSIELDTQLTQIILNHPMTQKTELPRNNTSFNENFQLVLKINQYFYFLNWIDYEFDLNKKRYHLFEPSVFRFLVTQGKQGELIFEKSTSYNLYTFFDLIKTDIKKQHDFKSYDQMKNYLNSILFKAGFTCFYLKNENGTINFDHYFE